MSLKNAFQPRLSLSHMAEDDRHIGIMDAESFSVRLHLWIYSPGLGQVPCAQPWDHFGSVPNDLGGHDQEVS